MSIGQHSNPGQESGALAPVAERHPTSLELHGQQRIDEYAWMRDDQNPAFWRYLAAERAYYERWTAHLSASRDELFAELSHRAPLIDDSVSWRHGGFFYYTSAVLGREFVRLYRRETEHAPAQLVLDENRVLDEEPAHEGYLALGVREPSPDGRFLAYSVDFDGDEVYQLRIRDVAAGTDLPVRIENTYYGAAWSADGSALFYTVANAAYRPYQVWRHHLGSPAGGDALVYQEDDERFEVVVDATRSGGYIRINTASRDTSETWLIPAHDSDRPPAVVAPRRPGVEYLVDHAAGVDGGELYLVTNDGAAEFRLLRGPAAAGPETAWVEVLAGAPDVRIAHCDVFRHHLVVTERHAFTTRLRVIARRGGRTLLIEADEPHETLSLAENRDYEATAVTVCVESLVEPPVWYDIDLADGARRVRKRQEVPGHDPSDYVSKRIFARAADGLEIPVTLAYRRGLRRDGSAPCLLWGYGAYESCDWPSFDPAVPSLLDRGFVYALAHVRGGGEGGRGWWLGGRLAAKRTTFTDFIAAADQLAGDGWVAGDRIVSRGLSAGGLLQGAVYSQAPQRWCGVVAEVPFVDCVTTMLDPAAPLTVNEWDEWGDPREPEAYENLRSYSPYENVPRGVRRPPLLVTGSLHDPRVLVHEPAKWVARLRATDTASSIVLFRAELGAGAHGGPSGRYERLRYEAEILAFVIEVARVGGESAVLEEVGV